MTGALHLQAARPWNWAAAMGWSHWLVSRTSTGWHRHSDNSLPSDAANGSCTSCHRRIRGSYLLLSRSRWYTCYRHAPEALASEKIFNKFARSQMHVERNGGLAGLLPVSTARRSTVLQSDCLADAYHSLRIRPFIVVSSAVRNGSVPLQA